MAEPFAICANDEESLACRTGAVPFIIVIRLCVRYDIKPLARACASVNEAHSGRCNAARYNRPLYGGIVKAKLWELEEIAPAPLFPANCPASPKSSW